jgi:hypothetical protein
MKPKASHFILIFLFLTDCMCKIVVLNSNETYPERIAAFGPRIEEDSNYSGVLVPVGYILLNGEESKEFGRENSNGCKIFEPPIPANISWIALVERGECTFVEKVRAMQKSGASAVIVGDNEQNNMLITMYGIGDVSDIKIPSVFTSQWVYRDLRYQSVSYLLHKPSVSQFTSSSLWVLLTKDDDREWPMLDIIIVTIIAPGVILLFLYFLWKFRRQRIVIENEDVNNDESGVLDQEDLDAMPTKVFFVHEKAENAPETCAVCIEDFEDGDIVRPLKCKHEFHLKCIDTWLLKRKKTCPICKKDMSSESIENIPEDAPLLEQSSSDNVSSSRSSRLFSVASLMRLFNRSDSRDSNLSENRNQNSP